jgi:hypothetical protein
VSEKGQGEESQDSHAQGSGANQGQAQGAVSPPVPMPSAPSPAQPGGAPAGGSPASAMGSHAAPGDAALPPPEPGGSATGTDETDPGETQSAFLRRLADQRDAQVANLPDDAQVDGSTAGEIRASAQKLRDQAAALEADPTAQRQALLDRADYLLQLADQADQQAAAIESGKDTSSTPEFAAQQRASAAKMRANSDAIVDQADRLFPPTAAPATPPATAPNAAAAGSSAAPSAGPSTASSSFHTDLGDLPSGPPTAVDAPEYKTTTSSGSMDASGGPPSRPAAGDLTPE